MPSSAAPEARAETEAPASHLVEVAFRGNRKEFFAWEGEAPPPLRAGVVVEVERGEDFGRVHSTGALAEVRCRAFATSRPLASRKVTTTSRSATAA